MTEDSIPSIQPPIPVAAFNRRVEDGKRAWEALFALWKDADPDLPLLVTARREARAAPLARAGREGTARLTRLERSAR